MTSSLYLLCNRKNIDEAGSNLWYAYLFFPCFLSCHLENLKDRLKKFDSPPELISVTINTLSKVCTFGSVMLIETSLSYKLSTHYTISFWYCTLLVHVCVYNSYDTFNYNIIFFEAVWSQSWGLGIGKWKRGLVCWPFDLKWQIPV